MSKHVLKSTFSLLNIDYVKLNKSWNYKNILSPFYRLYMVDDGHGRLFNPGSSHVLEKGYLYLIPAFTVCNYHCAQYLSLHYLHFIEDSIDGSSVFSLNRKIFKVAAAKTDIENFKRMERLTPRRGLYLTTNPKIYEKQPVLQGFRELNNLLPAAANMETQGIILQLLSRFLKAGNFEENTQKDFHSKIAAAVDFIQGHLQLPITVTQLAEKANQNPDYFSRIFQEHTGYRPLAYIQFKRIERAQFLIVTSNLSFNEIAAETGFDTLAYFSRIFKKITGQSPSQYKAINTP
jgi:AraC-like DNA-binding protein